MIFITVMLLIKSCIFYEIMKKERGKLDYNSLFKKRDDSLSLLDYLVEVLGGVKNPFPSLPTARDGSTPSIF